MKSRIDVSILQIGIMDNDCPLTSWLRDESKNNISFNSLGKIVTVNFVPLKNDAQVDGIFYFSPRGKSEPLPQDLTPSNSQCIYCIFEVDRTVYITPDGSDDDANSVALTAYNDDPLSFFQKAIDHIHAKKHWQKQLEVTPVQWVKQILTVADNYLQILSITDNYSQLCSSQSSSSIRERETTRILCIDLRIITAEEVTLPNCQRVFKRMIDYIGNNFDQNNLPQSARELYTLFLQFTISLIRNHPDWIEDVLSKSLNPYSVGLYRIIKEYDCFFIPVYPYQLKAPTVEQLLAVYSNTHDCEVKFKEFCKSNDVSTLNPLDRFLHFCNHQNPPLVQLAKQLEQRDWGSTRNFYEKVYGALINCLYRHSLLCDYAQNRPSDPAVKKSRSVIGKIGEIFDPDGHFITKDFTGLSIRESLVYFPLAVMQWCSNNSNVEKLTEIQDEDLQHRLRSEFSASYTLTSTAM